jgi:chaperonin cofactor prefoldin
LFNKKKNLESIGANTNELSAHLGCLGAKVSVNQKKYQQQLVEFEYFEKTLDELAKETIMGFQSRVGEVFKLLGEMFSDMQEVEAYQETLRHSLKDIENRRDTVLTSFNNLTVQRADLQELHTKGFDDLQV